MWNTNSKGRFCEAALKRSDQIIKKGIILIEQYPKTTIQRTAQRKQRSANGIFSFQ